MTKERVYVSPEWRPEERLALIARMASCLHETALAPFALCRLATLIHWTSLMPAELLEMTRADFEDFLQEVQTP